MRQPQVFFGYASQPELSREALFNASVEITKTGLGIGKSREQLAVARRIIIDAVLNVVYESDLAAFDVSTLNENVLFELGYAIGRAKRVWLLLDTTDAEANGRWRQFGLLSSVGYQGWANSDDIKTAFIRDQPHLATTTLYNDLIEPNLTPKVEGSLFYLPSFHATEASKRLGRRLDFESRRGVRLISADATESALNPLAWYTQKAYETQGTIAHLVAHRRTLAWLHNARAALVVGLAAGLERPVLLLAEEDYSAPLDYRDILRAYASASQCEEYASNWLGKLSLEPQRGMGGRRLNHVTRLRGLRFGEHVAENESDVLADYFVETAAFDDVLASRNTLFVGRKGSGKTANMLQAAARLREDARNLVIVIKPQSYDLEGLVALLSRLPLGVKSYTLQSLWDFLLQSEIAKVAVETIRSRPAGVPLTEAERELVAFVGDTQFGLLEEFAVRFERTVLAIEASGVADSSTLSAGRDLVNEALHARAIRRLRGLIGPVLKGRNRVAILIDNLDKAWDRHVELDAVANLLLGLLSASRRVTIEYAKEDFWRDRVSLSLATFLRSDIYAHLQRVAREPDKIPTSVISWEDSDLLLRVIEERFLAVQPADTDPSKLWNSSFCTRIAGMPTRDYLAWRVLPRPRDIVYICNAAVVSAINARREKVAEHDFLAAEQLYSQFAFEALLVENGITINQLEDVLFEFAGAAPVVGRVEALSTIAKVINDDIKVESVLNRLRAVSFFGVEVADNHFDYSELGPAGKRADVLARKLAEGHASDIRLEIHPAYRPYLQIREES